MSRVRTGITPVLTPGGNFHAAVNDTAGWRHDSKTGKPR